jgi:hypothetical protein
MLPKHKQMKKQILSSQTPRPKVSKLLTRSLCALNWPSPEKCKLSWCGSKAMASAGVGKIVGSPKPMTAVVPVRPMAADNMKPGKERSIRYHSGGFKAASADDSCSDDVQGVFRCET